MEDLMWKLQSLPALDTYSALPQMNEHYCTVSYADLNTHWITPDYIDLRVRSASLIEGEANNALKKHFSRRVRKQLMRLEPVACIASNDESTRHPSEMASQSLSDKDEIPDQLQSGHDSHNTLNTILSMSQPIVMRPSRDESLLIYLSNHTFQSSLQSFY